MGLFKDMLVVLAVVAGLPMTAKSDDHDEKKKAIYDRFEVVSFSRTQTPEGGLWTVVEAICGKFDSLEELMKNDGNWLANEVPEEFRKAEPPVDIKRDPVYVGIITFTHFDGITKAPRWQAYVAARKRGATEDNPSVNRIYFFHGNGYQRFKVDKDRVDKTAMIGHPGWGDAFDHTDAALQHPNGNVYFFSGGKYKRFIRKPDGDFKYNKTATIGVEGWQGVWEDGVDAALIHPNGKAYFFKGRNYRRIKLSNGWTEMEKEGIIGKDGWYGVWDDGIDAAVTHANGRAYFFKGDKYRRYNFKNDRVEKEGVIGEDGWMGVNAGIDAALEIKE